MKCRICGQEHKGKVVSLPGVYSDVKGEWDYFKCKKCGCLQIVSMPENISDFYAGDTYYSLNTKDEGFRAKMWDVLFRYQVDGKGILGRMIELVFPSNYKFIRGVSKDKKILDIGCGDGKRLRQLMRSGFKNLYGLEPNIPEDLYYKEGKSKIHIMKGSLDKEDFKHDRKYDLVIFEHSFEHIFDEKIAMKKACELLEDNGMLVIKIPFFSKYYWKHLGKHQNVLDPPRHFYIHTKNSLCALASECGLKNIHFSTETEPVLYLAAKAHKTGKFNVDNKFGIVKMLLTGIFTYPIRHKNDKRLDGACATFVFIKE